MRRKFFGWIAVSLCAAAAAVSGCSGNGGDASNYVVPSIPGMDVGQRYLSYLVNDYQSTDDCRLVITPPGTDESDTAAKEVKVSTEADYSAGKVDAEEAPAVKTGDKEFKGGICGFERMLRKGLTAKADAPSFKTLDAKASKAPNFKGKEAGYVDYIWLMSGSSEENEGYELVPVAKVLDDEDTVHCNILSYVETDEKGIMTPAVSKEAALAIAKVFDSYNPVDPSGKNTGIYNAVTSMVGHEWRKGGGRDGDLRLNIVLLTPEYMGGALGYVAVNDILNYADPNDEDAAPTYSNQGEYIYVDYATIIESEGKYNGKTLAHTLAHELTHLVYNNHKFFHDGNLVAGMSIYDSLDEMKDKYLPIKESLILSEGMAETNATRCGFGVRYADDGSSAEKSAEYNSLYFISSYLSKSGEAWSFPVSFFQATSATAYPAGHLFGLHVLNYYGEDKLNKLYTSTYTGIRNIQEALGVDANDVIHNYNLAIAMGGWGNIPSKYEIPYVNIGGENYCCTTSAYTVEPMDVNKAESVGKIYTKTGYNTKSFLPWYNGLLDLPCNYTTPLGVGVVVPEDARVNLIRTDSDGNFVELY